jgi:tRNA 2-selenouridine synthase
MPNPLASIDPLVHPHQMEIQDFASYTLVIDARSEAAYREDRLPGAINIPAAKAGPSLAHRSESAPSHETPASNGPPSVPHALAPHASRLIAGDTVLVYCDRGGLDSMVWAAPLRAAGMRVDVLGGGWVNYRRWVDAGLELLPRVLTFRRLMAPPVSGLCRILGVLAQQGEQVLDISAIAGQRLVPGLTLPGDELPSQPAFETLLLDALRHFDSMRPVWVRVGPAPLEGLNLPSALRDAFERSEAVLLEVPSPERARAWFERMQGMGTSLANMVDAFGASTSPPPSKLLEQWRALANAGDFMKALSGIIDAYIDPRNDVSRWDAQAEVMRLLSLDTEAVVPRVREWLSAHADSPAAARR